MLNFTTSSALKMQYLTKVLDNSPQLSFIINVCSMSNMNKKTQPPKLFTSHDRIPIRTHILKCLEVTMIITSPANRTSKKSNPSPNHQFIYVLQKSSSLIPQDGIIELTIRDSTEDWKHKH